MMKGQESENEDLDLVPVGSGCDNDMTLTVILL